MNEPEKRKNRLIALFLGGLLGLLGADRFYLGKWKTGLLKAVTLGGIGVWWFLDSALLGIDAFLHTFGRDTGFVKDSQGRDLNYGLSFWRIKNGQIVRDWF
ncbi:TM2 domain-containing protein [Marinobacter sp. ATCH36]|uniref:TM2 domain-containing protein n=1 Tax=Marinobacter sp. ATCH36 TaxID=2945106 RepID=UPI002021016C|nr:TM2 domain-containing protein [Marinobacter sp. ATCH36]MCL7945937.1 TM2 domain-containing protein [Marinobacter sp. ATCH36]